MIFPDVELVLTGLLRAPLLATHDVMVSNTQTATSRAFTVVIRNDGGPTGMATATYRVGVRIIGPPDQWQATGDLGRLVAAHLRRLPGRGPVVNVANLTEPYRVPTDGRPEFYLTGEITLTGEAFTPEK